MCHKARVFLESSWLLVWRNMMYVLQVCSINSGTVSLVLHWADKSHYDAVGAETSGCGSKVETSVWSHHTCQKSLSIRSLCAAAKCHIFTCLFPPQGISDRQDSFRYASSRRRRSCLQLCVGKTCGDAGTSSLTAGLMVTLEWIQTVSGLSALGGLQGR